MNCSDFQDKFDWYVDGELSADDTVNARKHVTSCRCCETMVTRHEQHRALLSTAVAELATAVDVSDLWSRVEAELGPQSTSVAAADRVVRPQDVRTLADRASDFFGLRPLGYIWRAGAWGGASALAAAAVVLMISAPQNFSPTQVASTTAEIATPALTDTRVASIDSAESRRARRAMKTDSPGAASSGFDIRRTSSRVDASEKIRLDHLETSPGHTVSTWLLPRRNARVIWVDPANSPRAYNVDYNR